MTLVPIVSSLLIIVGCFLPWLQLGSLFTNKGIDNPDGAIMLVASIIAGALAINNQMKNESKNTWVYTSVGILGILVAFYDLNEVQERAKKIAEGISEISTLIGDGKTASSIEFIGSGLHIVFVGSVGLLLCGLGFLNSQKSNDQPNIVSPELEKQLEIVAPKYAKIEEIKPEPVKEKTLEEIENEKYKSDILQLYTLIQKQKSKFLGGGMSQEIEGVLSSLVNNKQEGIHLLNSYHSLFKVDLIDDLKKLNSSLETTRQNLSLFIEFDIVKDIYPHERK